MTVNTRLALPAYPLRERTKRTTSSHSPRNSSTTLLEDTGYKRDHLVPPCTIQELPNWFHEVHVQRSPVQGVLTRVVSSRFYSRGGAAGKIHLVQLLEITIKNESERSSRRKIVNHLKFVCPPRFVLLLA